jgi:hypothetical protein
MRGPNSTTQGGRACFLLVNQAIDFSSILPQPVSARFWAQFKPFPIPTKMLFCCNTGGNNN